MRPLRKMCLSALFVLTVTLAIVLVGNFVGKSTPSIKAELTSDEAELCIYLSQKIVGKTVSPTLNVATFIECIASMNTD